MANWKRKRCRRIVRDLLSTLYRWRGNAAFRFAPREMGRRRAAEIDRREESECE
jgi:hypothetical protein